MTSPVNNIDSHIFDPDNVSSNKKFVSLTYIKGLSEKIKRNIIAKTDQFSFAFKPYSTLNNNLMTKNKQRIQSSYDSNCVYAIDCLSPDCSSRYFGETGRRLRERLAEHKRQEKNIHKRIDNKTAMIHHIEKTGHIFDIENAQIVDKETNKTKRTLLEATHIIMNSPDACNIKRDSENIHRSYHNTLINYKCNSPTYSTSRTHSPLTPPQQQD